MWKGKRSFTVAKNDKVPFAFRGAGLTGGRLEAAARINLSARSKTNRAFAWIAVSRIEKFRKARLRPFVFHDVERPVNERDDTRGRPCTARPEHMMNHEIG